VITFVHKSLNHLPYAKMQCINRQAAEIDLTFLALIIMERLSVLVELNIVCIKAVMTGDNMLTALSVARDCDDRKVSYASDLNESAESDGNTQIYFTKSDNQPLLILLNSQPNFGEISDLNSMINLNIVESGLIILSWRTILIIYRMSKYLCSY